MLSNQKRLKMHQTDDIRTIRNLLAAHLPELKRDFHIQTLEIFGSRVRNENHPDSDLDLLVSFSTPPSLTEFIQLKFHLSELLGLKIDLVMRNALKANIGKRILQEAIPV